MSAGAHAIRQLVWHLRARPRPAPTWLTPAEAALFERMPPADQLEGVRVAETLRRWGYSEDRELLAAGVLHDVGKSLAPAGVQYRVAVTALEALAPRLVPRLIRRGGAIGVLWGHAEAGGEMARRAGLPAGLAGLIAGHHSASADARMLALQRADGLY